jgi:hypothetical protein
MGPTAKQIELAAQNQCQAQVKAEILSVPQAQMAVVPPQPPTPSTILQTAVQNGANVDHLRSEHSEEQPYECMNADICDCDGFSYIEVSAARGRNATESVIAPPGKIFEKSKRSNANA